MTMRLDSWPLGLYEADCDSGQLVGAAKLQDKQNEPLGDAQAGGYFDTSGRHPAILLRTKEAYDGAKPSPNSVALINLARLSWMTGRADYRGKADKILAAFSRTVTETPRALPRMMAVCDFRWSASRHIVVAGAPDTEALLDAIRERFIPAKIVRPADGDVGPTTLARQRGVITAILSIKGKAAVYVCENFACNLPPHDPASLRRARDEIFTALRERAV